MIMQISYLSSEKTKKNIFLGFGKYFCFLKRKFCVCNNTKTRKHWIKLIIFIRFCKHCLLSPVQTGTFFLESLTSFPCSCAVCTAKIVHFSLPRNLVTKLVKPAFGQGKFVRVFSIDGRQRKLDSTTHEKVNLSRKTFSPEGALVCQLGSTVSIWCTNFLLQYSLRVQLKISPEKFSVVVYNLHHMVHCRFIKICLTRSVYDLCII